MAIKKKGGKGKGKASKGQIVGKTKSGKIANTRDVEVEGPKAESINDSLQSPQFMEDIDGDLEMDDGANSEMKSEETSEESKHLLI